MGDALFVLVILTLLVAVVTLLGHGLWLFFSFLGRSFFGGRAVVPEPKQKCSFCLRPYATTLRWCPNCGGDRESTPAQELREMEATERQLQQFRSDGSLDLATFQRLLSCLEERRRLLTGRRPAPATTERALSPVGVKAAEETKPAWDRLEQLVGGDRRLMLAEQRQALALLASVAEEDLRRLSAGAQRNLAHLLKNHDRKREAVSAYHRLLETHPDADEAGEIALEAGRYAARHGFAEQGVWFLETALRRPLTEEQRTTAESLLQRLRAPEEEVLEVLPAEPPSRVEAAPTVQEAPSAAVPATPAPQPRRRPLGELLVAFMEERNILWGELVGGLLMVGCSIALVISLWRTLEQIPYFPFLIFAGITASLFGAGLYTLHHWKLEATSRGLLIIATLLVPLSFLLLARLSREEGEADLLRTAIRLGTEAVAILIFVALVRAAGRVLVPGGHWLLTLAVLGTSLNQLLAARFVIHQKPGPLLFVLLGCLPVACHVLSSALFLRPAADRRPLPEAEAHGVFAFLGLATFAVVVALGFLVWCSDDFRAALHHVAVLVSVAGVPVLAGGLIVHRGISASLAEAVTASPPLSAGPTTGTSGLLRTAGTGVALAGMAVLLCAVLLAWPRPWPVFLACALDFAVLTVVAFRFRLLIAHVPALACFTVGVVTAYHLAGGGFAGDDATLAAVLLAVSSASVLIVVAVLLAAASEFLARRDWMAHSWYYAVGAGAVALAGLALAARHGLAEPGRAAVSFAVCAAGGLAVNLRWQRRWLGYLGLALLLGATLWGLQWQWPTSGDRWGLILAAETLALAAVAAWLRPAAAVVGGGDLTLAGIRSGLSNLATATAWREAGAAAGVLAFGISLSFAEFPGSRLLTVAFLLLAAAACLLAWTYRWVPLTWAGAALLLGGFFHLLHWDLGGLSEVQSLRVALLLDATTCLVLGLVLRGLPRWSFDPSHAMEGLPPLLERLWVRPLEQAAVVATVLALPALGEWRHGAMGWLALETLWLAGLWLLLALLHRAPGWFRASQAAVTVAGLFAVSAWLEAQPWVVVDYPLGLTDPRSLQAFGIGLALLSMFWIAVRIALRSSALAQQLLEPAGKYRWAIDRTVLAALVVGQLLLTGWGVWPEVVRELTPAGFEPDVGPLLPGHAHAYGAWAWLLLSLLAVVLVAALWDRRRGSAVTGLVLLAVTVPVLVAGRLVGELAAASTLRWGLAVCFLVGSAFVWSRVSLAGLASRVGIVFAPGERCHSAARDLLIVLSVAPVLLLTTAVAVIGFGGEQPAGPLEGSFFAEIGWVPSNIVPLLLVGLGLVGHALRERSAGFAFAAGLVLNVTLMGGYALQVVTGGSLLDVTEWVRIVQLGTAGAAAWALAWLTARRWVAAWREGAGSPAAGPLMLVQLGIAAAGNGLLVGVAVWLLAVSYTPPDVWTTEAASLLGLMALGLTLGAAAVRVRQRGELPHPDMVGLAGLAVLGLVACRVEFLWPGWGYRVLMLSWSLYALLWSLTGVPEVWERLPRSAHWRTHALHLARNDAVWVILAGVLAVLLGVKAAFLHEDRLWAAAAIGLASSAGAVMAVRRRLDEWAFAAGLGINLAASLVVWHLHRGLPLDDWWIILVQANLIAAAVVVSLWLALRQWLYEDLERRFRISPLFLLQIATGILGNLLLLAWPAAHLLRNPGEMVPADIQAVGSLWGWLALLLPFAAAIWYAAQAEPRAALHLVGLLGLCTSTLAAATVSPWDQGDWLAFHVWMVAALALAALATAWCLRPVELPAALRQLGPGLCGPGARRWAGFLGLAAVGLALRHTADGPDRPFWPALSTLAVAAQFAAMAVGLRAPRYSYGFALLINVAGTMAWSAWVGPLTTASFAYTQVLCLAAAAAAWSAVELVGQARRPAEEAAGWLLALPQAAVVAGLAVLGCLVATEIGDNLGGQVWADCSALTWSAVGLLALAAVLCQWDRTGSGHSLAFPYGVGLLAVGLALHQIVVDPHQPAIPGTLTARHLGWTAMAAYGLFVLLASVVAAAGIRRREDFRLVGLTNLSAKRVGWFAPAQAAAACLVLGLSVWVSLTFDTISARLAGPAAGILLAVAAVLLSPIAPGRWQMDLRFAALVLGVTVVAEGGWAALDPMASAVVLHRSVWLMTALALMTLVYGILVPRILQEPNVWGMAARRLGPVLGVLACLMVLAILFQEGLTYDPPTRRAPMAPLAIAAVAAALAGLIAAGISFAVLPGRDPFGLSDRRRTFYVYAAEALLALLVLHARLTVPELFSGRLARFWPFFVMALAYLGVGLGEFFQRRGLAVLAGPLHRTGVFLPMLPLLVFWLRLPGEVVEAAGRQLPGLQPLLQYLDKGDLAREQFARHALLWFLLGTLYAWLASSKRSFRFALSAALAANFGLWALFYHYGIGFLIHPQMWLIPLALIALVAEHLNRDRLTPPQSASIRYMALSLIYLSSTADMFIAELNNWWLPLVLAVLCVAGVLAGISLRVRAFLFLGVTFLFFDILTMIWHAAVDYRQTWIWWASGFVLGAAILALFAVFEKRRNDVLRVIEEIRRWQ